MAFLLARSATKRLGQSRGRDAARLRNAEKTISAATSGPSGPGAMELRGLASKYSGLNRLPISWCVFEQLGPVCLPRTIGENIFWQTATNSLVKSSTRSILEANRNRPSGGKHWARTYKSDWTMPYRLFRPDAKRKLPLVIYRSGSGGLHGGN